MPGVFMSSSNCDSPAWRSSLRSPVRTNTIMWCAWCAREVHTLRPLITQPSALRTARVRIDARSEPESGSLMPMQKNASPRAICGT
jgi:hypothetical protein